VAQRPSSFTTLVVNWFTIGCGIPFAAQSFYSLRSYMSAWLDRKDFSDRRVRSDGEQTAARSIAHPYKRGGNFKEGSGWLIVGVFLLGCLVVAGAFIWLRSAPRLSAQEQRIYDFCLSEGKSYTACDALIRVFRNEYGR
jgi:hypothetical protein